VNEIPEVSHTVTLTAGVSFTSISLDARGGSFFSRSSDSSRWCDEKGLVDFLHVTAADAEQGIGGSLHLITLSAERKRSGESSGRSALLSSG
jgi:hypothetical protein